MTDSANAALTRYKRRSLKPDADLQMILPTMEVYLATQISVPAVSSRRISTTRTSGGAASATVLIWERLE